MGCSSTVPAGRFEVRAVGKKCRVQRDERVLFESAPRAEMIARLLIVNGKRWGEQETLDSTPAGSAVCRDNLDR